MYVEGRLHQETGNSDSVKILHTYDGLISVNVLMKFHEEITKIVRVVTPEIKFC